MGLVFIPMNASAFATIAPHLRTDGSSLLNLARSIGSSIGISVMITLLSRNLQTSHSDLAGKLTASLLGMIDFSTLDRFQNMGEAALSFVDLMVNRQAAMVAYIDDFYLMMWMSLAVIPLTLFMTKADLRVKVVTPGDSAADLPH